MHNIKYNFVQILITKLYFNKKSIIRIKEKIFFNF